MTSNPPTLFEESELQVLLVEDCPADTRLILRRLEQDGYRSVQAVSTLAAALDVLRIGAPPDVVLADLHLPDGDGADTIAALRAVNRWVPIVVLTGDATHERGVASLAAGADEFLSKSDIGRISLHRALRMAIERHRLQSEMYSLVWDNAEPRMIFDRTGQILFGNAAAAELLTDGDTEALVGRSLEVAWLSGWHEIQMSNAAGVQVDLEIRTSPVSWHGVFAILGVLRDLRGYKELARQRQAAENAREASDSRLKQVLNELPISLWTTDAELRVRSQHGAAGLGLLAGSGVDAVPLEQASHHPQVLEAHREALVRGSARFQYIQDEQTVEGIVRSVRAERADEADTLLLGFAIDVTERKQLETQLLQAQKMDAVGRLAGGIAHDFNNLLTGILGFSHFVRERLDPSDSSYHDMEQVIRTAEQAAGITRQLLSFSRQTALEPRVVNLAESIEGARRLLGRLMTSGVQIQTDVEEALWPVKVDPRGFEQVLLNLCVNARDAMAAGGVIRVRASNVEVREGEPPAGLGIEIAPGSYVRVTIADEGCGMSPEVAAQAFEPFFSTKPEGEGTGLGLSIVYGIVQQSGGALRIESLPGVGTSIHLYWPRERQVQPPREIVLPALPATRASETILLVEDNRQVRELIQRWLEQEGYRVLPASDGAEALWRARQHEGCIHLVLADVIMPKVNGRALATRLALVRPEAKLLFISGHGDAHAITRDLGEGLMVTKPLTPSNLVQRVRAALNDGMSLGQLPRRKRVLVVDDDGGILRATDRLLRDELDVVLANHARDAVRRIDHECFDVIVCDLLMPDMNGVELHHWARVEHPEAASRFVFLTGAVGDHFIDGFLESAGRPVIMKPMDPVVMRQLVMETAEYQAPQ